MSEAKYFWRLVVPNHSGGELTIQRRSSLEYHDWYDVGWFYDLVKDGVGNAFLVLLNALLADKRRNPDGELDYSALSPETCKALRALGIEIPEGGGEVRKRRFVSRLWFRWRYKLRHWIDGQRLRRKIRRSTDA